MSKRQRHKANVVRKEAKRVQQLIENGTGVADRGGYELWNNSDGNSRRHRRFRTEKDWET